MYLVAVTTRELTRDVTFVYLHPTDRRIQLSPRVDRDVFLPTHADGTHALELALSFFGDSPNPCFMATLIGPDGPVRESYRGPKDGPSHAMAAAHAAALAAAL